jgi:hypothetical protein
MHSLIYHTLSKIVFSVYGEMFTEDDRVHSAYVLVSKRIGIKSEGKGSAKIAQRKSTVRINLHDDLEIIKSNMDKGTRNLINRGLRDENLFTHVRNFTIGDIEYYTKLHNDNAHKKLSLRSRLRLYYLCNNNKVLISTVHCKNSAPLFCHLIIVTNTSSMLLYSFENYKEIKILTNSSIRQTANRLLHFVEFEYLKEKGINYFDWAGVHLLEDGSKQSKIGKFKKSFGGTSCIVEDKLRFQFPSLRRFMGYG